MLIASFASCSAGKIPVERDGVSLAWAELFGGRGDRGIHYTLHATFTQKVDDLALRPGKNPAILLVADKVPNTYTGGTLEGVNQFNLNEARTTDEHYLLWSLNGQPDSLRISNVQQLDPIEHQ